MENHGWAATRIQATEIFQPSSELDTEIQPSVSKWPWIKAFNMLVCNIEVSVGLAILLENMERDQTVNAT
jgi:hypothetical protein